MCLLHTRRTFEMIPAESQHTMSSRSVTSLNAEFQMSSALKRSSLSLSQRDFVSHFFLLWLQLRQAQIISAILHHFQLARILGVTV
jgi:hypothetical protein